MGAAVESMAEEARVATMAAAQVEVHMGTARSEVVTAVATAGVAMGTAEVGMAQEAGATATVAGATATAVEVTVGLTVAALAAVEQAEKLANPP